MQTKAKSNSVVTTQLLENGHLQITVLGAGKLDFDPAKAHEDCRKRAEVHGWIQRLSDRAAKPRDTETGRPATPQDKYDAIAELVAHYMSGTGDWSMSGQGGGGKSITIEAIARLRGVDYATAEEFVAKYASAKRKMPDGTEMSFGGDTKAALAFLRDGKRVQEAIAAIRAERAPKAKVDADEALEELGEE